MHAVSVVLAFWLVFARPWVLGVGDRGGALIVECAVNIIQAEDCKADP